MGLEASTRVRTPSSMPAATRRPRRPTPSSTPAMPQRVASEGQAALAARQRAERAERAERAGFCPRSVTTAESRSGSMCSSRARRTGPPRPSRSPGSPARIRRRTPSPGARRAGRAGGRTWSPTTRRTARRRCARRASSPARSTRPGRARSRCEAAYTACCPGSGPCAQQVVSVCGGEDIYAALWLAPGAPSGVTVQCSVY